MSEIFSKAKAIGAEKARNILQQQSDQRERNKALREKRENDRQEALERAETLQRQFQSFCQELKRGGLSVKEEIVTDMVFSNSWRHNGKPIFSNTKSEEKSDDYRHENVVAFGMTIKSNEAPEPLTIRIVPSRNTEYNSNFYYEFCKMYDENKYITGRCKDFQECLTEAKNRVIEYLARIEEEKILQQQPEPAEEESEENLRARIQQQRIEEEERRKRFSQSYHEATARSRRRIEARRAREKNDE